MSYVALYRKFRPPVFEDVKGQEPIVTALKNQIKTEHTVHSYLFVGTRGTGKTTVAKIFAKAVNCENPVDGSPCCNCPSCRAIAEGRSMNVVEMDAASNNGVDDVRNIIEELSYPPTEGRYKVYIIDEVHMLSDAAFNALLKTLEEPPAYAIFILATTEAHKLPITILSRCQRYDFRRISIDTIAGRLTEVIRQEGVSAEERAVRYIAKAADGSMRDGLSLLDQCIAFYLDEELTYDKVLSVLGAVDTDIFEKLLRGIYAGDVASVINIIEEVVIEGRELGQFITDFIWFLRNLLLLKNTENMEDVLDISTENMNAMKELADSLDDMVIMRYIRVLSDLSNQLRYSSQKRVLIEIAMMKLCRPQMETDNESLLDRVRQLETSVASGVVVQTIQKEAGDGAVNPAGKATREKKPVPDAVPEDLQQVLANWGSLIADMGYLHKRLLSEATVIVNPANQIELIFDAESETGLGYSMADKSVLDEVMKVIEDRMGKHVTVVSSENTSPVAARDQYEDAAEFFKNSGIEVEVEDF